MKVDTSFLDDNSKEIKELLIAFCGQYESFTDEEKEATKKWLDDLAALQHNAPACFQPKIILSKSILTDPENDKWLCWSFPVTFLVKAIAAMEQRLKYVITVDDKLDWHI